MIDKIDPDKVYDINEVASYFGVARATLRNTLNDRDPSGLRFARVGKQYKIPGTAIIDFKEGKKDSSGAATI